MNWYMQLKKLRGHTDRRILSWHLFLSQNCSSPPEPKSSARKKQKSWVWNHASKLQIEENGRVVIGIRCNYCGTLLKTDSSTSGMGRHLKAKHPALLKSGSHQSTLVQAFENSKSAHFNAKVFEDKLLRFVVLSELPFRIVEEPSLMELLCEANPHVNLFSRGTLRRRILQLHQQLAEKMRTVLQETPGRICLSLDMWSTKNNLYPYMGILGHWIDEEWNLRSALLAFKHMPQRHTGENMANCIWKVLTKLNIKQKVGCSHESHHIRRRELVVCDFAVSRLIR